MGRGQTEEGTGVESRFETELVRAREVLAVEADEAYSDTKLFDQACDALVYLAAHSPKQELLLEDEMIETAVDIAGGSAANSDEFEIIYDALAKLVKLHS